MRDPEATKRTGRGATSSRRQSDEVRLIERAKQGDKKALAELYDCHVELIYRYILARVRNEPVAEDLTAQVFVRMLEGLSEYEPCGKPFAAWLYRIAYARTVDHWRQQHRRQETMLDDSWPGEGTRPDELLELEADWRTAVDLLAQLTDDQQDVIILRFIGEMSLAEVADILGKTVGATKALQHRALLSMSRLLNVGAEP